MNESSRSITRYSQRWDESRVRDVGDVKRSAGVPHEGPARQRCARHALRCSEMQCLRFLNPAVGCEFEGVPDEAFMIRWFKQPASVDERVVAKYHPVFAALG